MPDLADLLRQVVAASQPENRTAKPANSVPLGEGAHTPATEALLLHLATAGGGHSPFLESLDFLSARRRVSPAERVAGIFVTRFPNDPLPLRRAVAIARARGHLSNVAERARLLRTRFPGQSDLAAWEIAALRMMRRHDEAAGVLRETIDEAAPQRELLVEGGLLALAALDWDRAIDLAALLRKTFPDEKAGYTSAVRALQAQRRYDEATAILDAAAPRFAQAPWLLVQRAKLASARSDFALSDRLWADVRTLQPDDVTGYVDGAGALLKIGREADAEALLAEARTRFPGNRDVALRFAKAAAQRRDWAALEERSSAARAQFPGDMDIALAHAHAPMGRGKRGLDQALLRFQTIRQDFREHAQAIVQEIRLRRENDDLPGAEQAGAAAVRGFPASGDLTIEHARTLVKADRLDAASAVLAEFLETHADDTLAQTELADVLSQLGRHAEAENLASAALARLPFHLAPNLVHARVASRRGDVEAAKHRWDAAVARFPNDLDLRKAAYGAEQIRMSMAAEAHADAHGEAPPIDAAALRANPLGVGSDDLSSIFSHFESLGGLGQGCEFGLVQRLSGIEPLGLLRWARMRPENLTALLEENFAGVGTPEQTELTFYDENVRDPEYTVRDFKFGMQMHTFTRKSDIAFDKMFKSTCRRLAFLKGKLLDDLASEEKIFVYKTFSRNLEPDDIRKIHALLCRYGKVVFLYVRYSDAEHPSGHVEWLDERLLVGYIERFSMTMSGQALTPLMTDWVSICSGAVRLWKEGLLF